MALAGKKALVVGVANHRSIAWGVAQAWKQAGATVFVTYQNDRFRPTVTKLLEGWKDSQIDPGKLPVMPILILIMIGVMTVTRNALYSSRYVAQHPCQQHAMSASLRRWRLSSSVCRAALTGS